MLQKMPKPWLVSLIVCRIFHQWQKHCLSLADLGMTVGEADKEKSLVKLNIVDLADFVGPLESLNQIATACGQNNS